MKIVLLDCDGVLADWSGHILRQLDLGFQVEDLTEFKLTKVLREKFGPDAVKRMNAICADANFTLSQPSLPWALDLVQVARSVGETTVLTAPWASCPGWYDARVKWLKRFDFEQDDILVGKRKYLVSADYLIDDKPSNIIEWSSANPKGIGILLAWNYNQNPGRLPINAMRMTPEVTIDYLKLLAQE